MTNVLADTCFFFSNFVFPPCGPGQVVVQWVYHRKQLRLDTMRALRVNQNGEDQNNELKDVFFSHKMLLRAALRVTWR